MPLAWIAWCRNRNDRRPLTDHTPGAVLHRPAAACTPHAPFGMRPCDPFSTPPMREWQRDDSHPSRRGSQLRLVPARAARFGAVARGTSEAFRGASRRHRAADGMTRAPWSRPWGSCRMPRQPGARTESGHGRSDDGRSGRGGRAPGLQSDGSASALVGDDRQGRYPTLGVLSCCVIGRTG